MAIDDQIRKAIRHEIDATLFVEAGAGTGKTTQLVGRIIELICSGRARIDQIAAITFTEAAAAELRDRLASELDRLDATSAPDQGRDGVSTTAQGRAYAREALTGLDGAAISTLHGFARRVLTEHSFEAGLPPVIEVLDEIRSQVEFEERWTVFLDELLSDEEAGSSVLLALTCDVTLDHLKAVAKKLNDNWDLIDRAANQAPFARIDVSAATVVAPLRRALELRSHCQVDDDLLLAHLRAVTSYVARLEGCHDDLETLRALVSGPPLKAGRHGRAPDWNGYKPQIVELLAEADEARTTIVNTTFRRALSHLLDRISEQTLATAAMRQKEGRLQFHDLLVLARDLVRHSPSARAELRQAYPFLLIDEFQDTDPIQAELAFRIASSDGNGADKHWSELAVDPGRLFFVGDPKQSIYRFRRADIALFLATRDLASSDALALTTSFRAAPQLVAWFNHAFGRLIDGTSGHQPVYQQLAADPDRQWVESPVGARVLYLGEEAAAGVNIPEIRRREMDDIARAIERVRREGWPLGPTARAARLSDITVLIPARTALPTLQVALDDYNIPYRLESSSLVYSAPEVRDLLSVTAAVDDPTNEVAVVAALRSPGFGCGDDDLLAFRLARGSWDYRRMAPAGMDASHPVVRGLADLRALHERCWHVEVSSMMEEILTSRRFLALALDGPRYRESWRRLRFVCDQARQFTDSTGSDLRHYLSWVDLQRDDEARVTEVVLPETDIEAVRIMTVHAAKGLEFPVVVLAGLGAQPNNAGGVDVLFAAAGCEVKVNKERSTEGYDDLAATEKLMEQAEGVRLLYVAATRACDFLIVSLHRKAKPKERGPRAPKTLAEQLAEATEDRPDLWRHLESEEEMSPAQTSAAAGSDSVIEPNADSEAARAQWIGERMSLLERAKTPNTLSATAVVRLAHSHAAEEGLATPAADVSFSNEPTKSDEESVEPTSTDSPAWRKGRAGTAVGRAVHATLQSIDLATGEGLHELAMAQAVAEGVTHRVRDIEAMVRAALDSSDVRRATANRYWREIYVGAPVDGRVLEGFIDLLIDGPDGLEVIDYKTNQVEHDSDLDALMAANRIQGAAYAVAVEEAVGRPVSSCRFLFLTTDGSVSRKVEDLNGAKRTVRSLLSVS